MHGGLFLGIKKLEVHTDTETYGNEEGAAAPGRADGREDKGV